MLEQNKDLNPNLNPMPVTDNTVSIEQVAILEPKRKWWLIILISVVGILIIGGGVYAFLFFNKPAETVIINEPVNTEPPLENIAEENVIPEGYKLFDSQLQTNSQTKEGDFDISFYYPESFDTIKYEPGTEPEVEMFQSAEPHRYMIISTLQDNEYVRDNWIKESTSCDDDDDGEECQIKIFDNFSIKKYKDIDGEERIQLYGKRNNKLVFILMKELVAPYVEADEVAILTNVFNTIKIQLAGKIISADDSDIDSDGLADKDELKYGTDTNNPDTDADGYKDGDEVKNGYNPVGDGKLIQDNNTISSIEVQVLLDSLAKSINEQNGQAFLDILSPNNDMYSQVQADSVRFVATFHTYFQKKNLSFVLLRITEEKDGVFRINNDILLDGEVFETNEPIFIENVEGVWKLLKM